MLRFEEVGDGMLMLLKVLGCVISSCLFELIIKK